jgi:hypothetical protein
MTQEQQLSDAELVRRLSSSDVAAFEALYRRYDAAVVSALRRQVRGFANPAESAREIVDDLWIELWAHPGYLLKHDPGRRPLGAFLAYLARQMAKRAWRTKQENEGTAAHRLGSQEIVDPATALDQMAEQWQELMHTLPRADVAFLDRILASKRKRTKKEQKRLERLIQKLRRRIDLD